jgi:integrase
MAKLTQKLTDLKVRKGIEPASYPDGNGLYLQIRKSGAKDWFYRYEVERKGRKKGLGSYPTISLQDAREAAHECRILRKNGIDPVEHFQKLQKEQALAERSTMTFRECAETLIDAKKAEWKNEKHQYQWSQSLISYAYPHIGDLSVQEINLTSVLKVLEPIWQTKTETASRVRQRVEAILDWAKVREYRVGENPARWRGHLDKLLPSPKKIQKVVHQPAMEYMDVSAFYMTVRTNQTVSKLALAFIILTATRSKETRFAQWDEIDLTNRVWTIPEERTKSDREQRIPLTEEMVSILKQAESIKVGNFVFPSTKTSQGISDTAVRKQLQDKHAGLTVHGFRSSFRDWCAEMTNYPRELAEKALGHVLTDKVEAAYQRGDMFEKRRKLMESWNIFCLKSQSGGDVVPINIAAK